MSKAMVKKNSKVIQERVWLHTPTFQLGYVLPKTWLGDLFFFAEHDDHETLTHDFCNFIDDPRDELSFHKKDFIDLGPL